MYSTGMFPVQYTVTSESAEPQHREPGGHIIQNFGAKVRILGRCRYPAQHRRRYPSWLHTHRWPQSRRARGNKPFEIASAAEAPGPEHLATFSTNTLVPIAAATVAMAATRVVLSLQREL